MQSPFVVNPYPLKKILLKYNIPVMVLANETKKSTKGQYTFKATDGSAIWIDPPIPREV